MLRGMGVPLTWTLAQPGTAGTEQQQQQQQQKDVETGGGDPRFKVNMRLIGHPQCGVGPLQQPNLGKALMQSANGTAAKSHSTVFKTLCLDL